MSNEIKTYKDYLIDYDSLKVGDKLWSITQGYVTIKAIVHGDYYEITATSLDTKTTYLYDRKGCHYIGDKIPVLFKEKPDFFKEKKKVKTYTWYCLAQNGHHFLEYDMPEHELPALIKKFENFSNKLIKWEKIDCTEKLR